MDRGRVPLTVVTDRLQELHNKLGSDHKINWSIYDDDRGVADGVCPRCGEKFKVRLDR